MDIFYIHHSCFAVALSRINLIFDYYEGENQIGRERIEKVFSQLNLQNPCFTFVSHKHHDHFSHNIFQWINKFQNIQFILSNDCRMSEKYRRKVGIPKEADKYIHYVGKNKQYNFTDIRISTLTSTDEGVAFCIECEDKFLYHSGDLNWWTWKGETEQESLEMEKSFKREIAKIKENYFDIAFLPLDPRQEERFYLGFDYFMKNTKTKLAYPMHFWGEIGIIEDLKKMDCAKEYSERIAKIEWYK